MPDIIGLGSFMIKGSLLAVIVAAIAGWIAVKLVCRRADAIAEVIPDLLVNGALIVIVFWKFGFVWESPELIWENPKMLLFMTGSVAELVIGCLLALIYVVVASYRRGIRLLMLGDVLSVGILAGVAVLGAWHARNPESLGRAAVAVIVAVWLLYKKARLGSGKILQDTLLFAGAGWMLSTLLFPQQQGAYLLSQLQWVYLGCVLAGILLPKFASRGEG